MKTVTLILCVLLVGCAAPSITTRTDPYRNSTNISAPPIETPIERGKVETRLAVSRQNGRLFAYSIEFVMRYNSLNPRIYDEARDDRGTMLDVMTAPPDVSPCGTYTLCGFAEYLDIATDRPYLEAHRASGIRIKIYGEAGEIEVLLPPAYVAAFLDAAR